MAPTDEMVECPDCGGEGKVLFGVDLLDASPDFCYRCAGSGKVVRRKPLPLAPTDEQDPVLIPSLPDPWEGLVRNALHSARMAECAELTADFPGIVGAQHAASRAEKALRVALRELLGIGNSDP